MNRNLDPVQIFFLRDGWGGQCPQIKFFKLLELFEMSRARQLILGMHLNIDKASSRRYDFTQ